MVRETRRQLVDELEVIDARIKAAKKQLAALVAEAGSGLLSLNGIGPSGAARLLGDDLLGADRHHQDAVVATALAEQHALDSAPADDDAVLDVSGRSPAEVIADVARSATT